MEEKEIPKLRFILKDAPQILTDQWSFILPPPNPNFPNPNHDPCCDDYHMRLAWSYVDEVIKDLEKLGKDAFIYEVGKLQEASDYMASVLDNRTI